MEVNVIVGVRDIPQNVPEGPQSESDYVSPGSDPDSHGRDLRDIPQNVPEGSQSESDYASPRLGRSKSRHCITNMMEQ